MVEPDAVVANALDRAVEGVATLSHADQRFLEELRHQDPSSCDHSHVEALRIALSFSLAPDGTFFSGFINGVVPSQRRTLENVPSDALPVWDAYADKVRSRRLCAHLHDLLNQTGARPTYRHVRPAIEAYLDAAPIFAALGEKIDGRLHASRALTRALGLAMEMNQRDVRPRIEREILKLASDFLDDDPVPFGLVLELLEPMAARRLQPEAVRELIERALGACSEVVNQWQLLELLRMLDRNPADHKQLDARVVEAITARADRSAGVLRLSWLNTAATWARNAGLTEQHEASLLAMQEMRGKDWRMVWMPRPGLEFTEDDRAAAAAVIGDASDFIDALRRIAGAPPPAGFVCVACRMAIATASLAPFGSRVARGTINPAGPVLTGPAREGGFANVVTEIRREWLRLNGEALAAKLDRLYERFQPDAAQLEAVFGSAADSASKRRMLARAFEFYWAGDDDAAAIHLALPRVEDLLRQILRARGVPIISVAKGETLGGVNQLGALLSAMKKDRFDPDSLRSLALVLHEPRRGLNLRNDVCHGLIDCPPRYQVALVLHAAVFLLAVLHSLAIQPAPGETEDRETPAPQPVPEPEP